MTHLQTAAEFAQSLREAGLLTADQVRELGDRFRNIEALADELFRRSWLTAYQRQICLDGRAASLVLGPYLLLDPLGEGGMGQVFRARHVVMDRIVALKLIRPELLMSARAVERFQREIRLAARLNHPNVVIAHDAQSIGGRHFLVMEYVPGVTLFRLVCDRGALPVGEVCEYIRQAALGLQHAHSHGLIHRDVKPENLLIAGGVVKVADLGLARLVDEEGGALTGAGAVVGTPDYLAPEQANNSRDTDARTDIYSLGGAFYFALTGRVPFPGGGLLEKIGRHLIEPPTPIEQLRPNVPEPVRAIVYRMIAKQKDARFPTAAALAQALEPFCKAKAPVTSSGVSGELPSTLPGVMADTFIPAATAPTIPNSTVRPRRFDRRILLAGGLVAVGGAAAAILLPRSSSSSPSQPAELPPRKKAEVAASPGRWKLLRECGPFDVPWDVYQVDMSLDGKYLAIVSGWFDFPEKPGVVGLIERESGKFTVLGEHTHSGHCVAFTPDSKTIISAAGSDNPFGRKGGELKFWNVSERRLIETLDIEASCNRIAIDPDGRRLAYAGIEPVVRLFDIEKRREERQLRGSDKFNGPRGGWGIAFSSDGKLVAAGSSEAALRVWRAADGELVCEIPPPVEGGTYVASLGFRDNDREVVGAVGISRDDGIARIIRWNVAENRIVKKFDHGVIHVFGAALSPDGRSLVTVGQSNDIFVWDVLEGRKLQTLPGREIGRWACFSPDGQTFATCGNDRCVRLWGAGD